MPFRIALKPLQPRDPKEGQGAARHTHIAEALAVELR